MAWNSTKIVKFIKEIEIRPLMWEYKNPDYKNREKKHDATQKLAFIFDCDNTEVLRKWRIILAQYRREKHKLKSCEAYVPKWFAFSHLAFLHSGEISSEEFELTEQLSDREDDDFSERLNVKTPEMTETRMFIPLKSSSKRRRSSPGNPLAAEATVSQDLGQKLPERSNDDVAIFSAGVAAKLRKITNARLKILVQRDIDNLLYDAIIGTGKYATSNT